MRQTARELNKAMTTQVAANRVNHKDIEFDADYATVAGNDARNYQIGSFIEVAAIEEWEKAKLDFRTETAPTDEQWKAWYGHRSNKETVLAHDVEEKIAHEAWMAHA